MIALNAKSCKMRKCSSLFILLWTLTGLHATYSQYYNQQSDYLNANKYWAFGTQAGLDFTSGSPSAVSPALVTTEGCASVSDPVTGQLLFYTNGRSCWNRSDTIMPNGDSLQGNVSLSTTDGVCVVPMIDSPGKYYLFSVTGATGNFDGNGALYYSVVDMNLEGGLGDIMTGRKNILLDSDSVLSEGMTAIPGNNCDIWLMVHAYVEPVFKAYHITSAGISPTPILSQVGEQIHQSVPFNGNTIGSYLMGGMTVSPTRDKIVINSFLPVCYLAASPDSFVGALICEFNPDNGELSNAIEVGQNAVAYNSAFSPDGSKLYMIDYDLTGMRYQLLQYDVSNFDSAAINGSRLVIDSMVATSELGGYLRLYGDTIYVNTYDSSGSTNYISMITQPNLSGTAANFLFKNMNLIASSSSNYVFPKEVVYPMDPVTNTLAWDTTICMGWDWGIVLTPLVTDGGYTYAWSDGSTDSVLTISDAGTYWVSYTDGCHFRTDTFKVAGEDLDPVITIDVQQLSTIGTYASYQWLLNGAALSGATGRTYDVLENGDYQVIVSDGGACIDTSDIYEVNNLDIAGHPLKDRISIYPNPTQDNISIHAPVPVNISLKDVTGKLLWQQKDAHSLSLSNWSDGIYFLHIRDRAGKTVKVEKIIKQQ